MPWWRSRDPFDMGISTPRGYSSTYLRLHTGFRIPPPVLGRVVTLLERYSDRLFARLQRLNSTCMVEGTTVHQTHTSKR
jgi:hypothetical protein